MEKVDARKISPEAQQDRRIRAFELRAEGFTYASIAQAIGVTERILYTWFRRARTDGKKAAIKGGTRGRRRFEGAKLNESEQTQLKELLVNKKPSDYGFEHSLWHSTTVGALIKKIFKVTYSRSGICALLKRMGLSYQRPKKQAIQADEAKLEAWVNETYPAIKADAKKRGALIFWQDETSLKQDANWVRGWAPVGETPVLLMNGRARYGQAVLSVAISNRGDAHFLIQDTAVTAKDFRDFLDGLRKEFPNRLIFVICDNASIHKAAVVKAWLEEDGRMELKFLPPYAPKLNPVEVFNQTLKCRSRMATAKDSEGNKKLAEEHLKDCSKYGGRGFRKCFEHECTKYAKR